MMKSACGEIIYVGKARKLRNRVSQYFIKKNVSLKTECLVSNTSDFSYVVTSSEFEALVLECSLIKNYLPRYNILLKDDKGYSYIRVTGGIWPRLKFAKNVDTVNDEYIGPYTSSWIVRNSLDEALKIFKLPVCNRNFYDTNEPKPKNLRPCLYFYIKQCDAPCCGKISNKEFIDSTVSAVKFLKGSSRNLIKELNLKMIKAAKKLDFEKAEKLKSKILALENIKKKQNVVSIKIKDQDVISFCILEDTACFEVFKIRNGSLIDEEVFFVNFAPSENFALDEFITRYYEQFLPPSNITLEIELQSKEVLVKWFLDKYSRKVSINVARRGEQLRLVNLCKNNAQHNLLYRLSFKKNRYTILDELKKILNLNKKPEYIEAYDVSNLGAEDNVGCMVVFKNAKPLKSAYKKFKISDTVRNDYKSMRQMVSRRVLEYDKLKNTGVGFGKMPDIIFVDGGLGHVLAIKKVLKKDFSRVKVFGIKKDKKHKTVGLVSSTEEIQMVKTDCVFLLLEQIQNEVHRFTINYNRSKRKNKLKSELLSIKGIGPKTVQKLIRHFGSVEKIKDAELKEFEAVSGLSKSLAKKIKAQI